MAHAAAIVSYKSHEREIQDVISRMPRNLAPESCDGATAYKKFVIVPLGEGDGANLLGQMRVSRYGS